MTLWETLQAYPIEQAILAVVAAVTVTIAGFLIAAIIKDKG